MGVGGAPSAIHKRLNRCQKARTSLGKPSHRNTHKKLEGKFLNYLSVVKLQSFFLFFILVSYFSYKAYILCLHLTQLYTHTCIYIKQKGQGAQLVSGVLIPGDQESPLLQGDKGTSSLLESAEASTCLGRGRVSESCLVCSFFVLSEQ